MLQHLNSSWFSLMNAQPGLQGWRLDLALFAAQWLILLIPVGLTAMWMSGVARQRESAVRALVATCCALGINFVIGLLWPHERPFVAGIGQAFLAHAPTSSFPSNHGTIMFTVALVLACSGDPAARRFGRSLLPLAVIVAWSRVFVGVHWPLDMVGALVLAVCMTLLFRTAAGQSLSAAVAQAMASLYRRLMAVPIARGWLRR